jgi:hypothetical protein
MGIGIIGLIATAAAVTETYIGDTIPLSGYAYGSSTVYLFLTGPNLPANGVPLDNVNARADQGSFTRVDVGADQRWTYTWDTHVLGGQLDPGTYTIWVADAPVDRSQLAGYEYSTITVNLKRPTLSVETPTPIPAGAMFLRSDPRDAGIFISGEYRGMTPLMIEGFSQGIYQVTFAKYGYENTTTTVVVEPGAVSYVNVTLFPLTGAIAVNTSPAGAHVIIHGGDSGTGPVIIGNLMPGNHTLTVEMPGYLPIQKTVEVTGGSTTGVNISLVLVDTPSKAGLFAPGTVLALVAGLIITVHTSRRPD